MIVKTDLTHIVVGEILEDHREVRLPSTALGEIHHSEWRLSAQNTVIIKHKNWILNNEGISSSDLRYLKVIFFYVSTYLLNVIFRYSVIIMVSRAR